MPTRKEKNLEQKRPNNNQHREREQRKGSQPANSEIRVAEEQPTKQTNGVQKGGGSKVATSHGATTNYSGRDRIIKKPGVGYKQPSTRVSTNHWPGYHKGIKTLSTKCLPKQLWLQLVKNEYTLQEYIHITMKVIGATNTTTTCWEAQLKKDELSTLTRRF